MPLGTIDGTVGRFGCRCVSFVGDIGGEENIGMVGTVCTSCGEVSKEFGSVLFCPDGKAGELLNGIFGGGGGPISCEPLSPLVLSTQRFVTGSKTNVGSVSSGKMA